MSADHTQQQSPQELDQARDLSLRRTQPPGEAPGYEARSWLGSGAFGEVWIGVDCNTGRRVAIKFYTHRSGLDWTLLSREVEKLVFLSADRYVVQLLDVGWSANPPYYVMEFIENGSLEELLREHGRLAVSEAIEIFREVAVGLIHAHGKGVLHCDLKPANILLDQDNKPRLADFGQSRLSHEQSPALGTLFYMAPEQADLQSVPDARWDVYALGAILYCMLTGEPPHRVPETTHELDAARGLPERLARYRRLIESAPPPAAHRRVSGVDRALADIVDRCLAADPRRRFPNVQSVLDALEARDAARIRRPLMLLGFVGPVLLLVIMAVFGLRGYDRAMRDSEQLISVEARERQEMTAKLAATSIEGEIFRYFGLVEREAVDPRLREKFLPVAAAPLVAELNARSWPLEEIQPRRRAFIADPLRQDLNAYLQQRLDHYLHEFEQNRYELKLASFLVVDATGRMLAVAYDHDEPSRSIGWNYAYRTYFHGGPADLAGSDPARKKYELLYPGVTPIRDTHFSAAFPSTTTGLWKIAVSTPIFEDGDRTGEVIGVLGLTVNLGDFAYIRRDNSQDRFAVLIDGRPGPNRGVILQHPLFNRMSQDGRGPAEDYSTTEFRVTDEQLARLQTDPLYHDPLQEAAGGQAYRDQWIAAVADVRLPDAEPQQREMIVLVQERLAQVTAPVQQLGARLMAEGLWALGGVVAVILVLWYIVLRTLSEPRAARLRPANGGGDPTPIDGLTTLPAPRKKKS